MHFGKRTVMNMKVILETYGYGSSWADIFFLIVAATFWSSVNDILQWRV